MLRCVIFDLDNTLVNSDLDFRKIRDEIGTAMTILEYRATASDDEKRRVDAILDRHESAAAESCDLRDGAPELFAYLKTAGVRMALLTRNSRRSVETICRRLGMAFDMIVSREDSEPKPSPQPVRMILERLGCAADEAIMVGDYLYDVQAAQSAGVSAILLDGPHRSSFTAQADHEATRLRQTLHIIRGIVEEEETK